MHVSKNHKNRETHQFSPKFKQSQHIEEHAYFE